MVAVYNKPQVETMPASLHQGYENEDRALKQETYNLSDVKHDLHCGFKFVELGGSVTV